MLPSRLAAAQPSDPVVDMTGHPLGLLALGVFVGAYIFVILEELLDLRKSKPVVFAAGIIWVLIAIVYNGQGQAAALESAASHTILEFAVLMLFLMVAITYVNTLEERRVFDVLRAKLIARSFSYRQLFWITGVLAFVLSPVLDNLTTSLVLGAVALAVGAGSRAFAALACINIVVAANAGGAFSPFGDITTLMVWQKGKLEFWEFFAIFVPSVLNWVIPAFLMQFAVPKLTPEARLERRRMKPGSWGVIVLFAGTIATAVSFKNFLHLPAAMGMMLGLGYLQLYSWALSRRGKRQNDSDMVLDSFQQIARVGVGHDSVLFRHYFRGRRPRRYRLPRSRQSAPLWRARAYCGERGHRDPVGHRR